LTLDEMLNIPNIGGNPKQCREIIVSTNIKYNRLLRKKEELEQRPKTRNPFKAFENYRAARVFLAASKNLYIATRSRSEEVAKSIGRSFLDAIQEEDVESVQSDPAPGTNIRAIAVRMDRPWDDTTRQQVLDAASTITAYSGRYEDDQSISEASTFHSDDYFLASESLSSLVSGATEASEDTPDTTNTPTLSSPTVVNNNYNYTFYGSMYSPNSNIQGPTVQVGGSQNSGSLIHTIAPPNSP